MAITLTEKKQWRSYSAIPGGTAMECFFPIGSGVTLADAGLLPRGQTIPGDTEAGIVNATITPRDGKPCARVIANVPDYWDSSAQARTGAVTIAAKVCTSAVPIFYPSLAGNNVTLSVDGAMSVDTVDSATQITLDDTPSGGTPQNISFDEGSRELVLSQVYRWLDRGYWAAVKRYACAPADKEMEVLYLATTTFSFPGTNISGDVFDIRANPKGHDFPHKAIIEIEYRTAFNPHRYPIGKATIQMMMTRETERLHTAVSGTHTAMQWWETDNGYFYQVVDGTNEVPKGFGMYIVRTALDASNEIYEALEAMKGKVNAAEMPKIANAAAEQMLCIDVQTGRRAVHYDGVDYMPVQIIFLRHPAGSWIDNGCTVQKMQRYPIRLPVLHVDDDGDYVLPAGGSTSTAAEALFRTVMRTTAVAMGADNGVRECYATYDFSTIYGYVSWLPAP